MRSCARCRRTLCCSRFIYCPMERRSRIFPRRWQLPFRHPDAGSQCAAGAAVENPDSWAGSGNAGWASGSGGGICRQHEAGPTAGEARASAIQHGQTGDASVGKVACSGSRTVDSRQAPRQTGAARTQTVEFLNRVMTAGGRVRVDGRTADQMRPLKITPDFISTAEGSVLIELGNTRVICTATVDDGVPGFLKGSGKGWVTSEYGMLPRATEERTPREATRGKQSGRTLEIQRLIGRSLRAVTDQEALGERTVWIDCDVIQADGGTRTASITGAFVALALAFERMVAAGILK